MNAETVAITSPCKVRRVGYDVLRHSVAKARRRADMWRARYFSLKQRYQALEERTNIGLNEEKIREDRIYTKKKIS
jgi:hypothetical protein